MGIRLHYVDRGPCDKCGKDVDPGNNMAYWQVARQALAGGRSAAQELEVFARAPLNMLYTPRHLLPTEDCEGSPSCASQALEGKVSLCGERRLPKEEWIPLPEEEAADAIEAYRIIQEIEDS